MTKRKGLTIVDPMSRELQFNEVVERFRSDLWRFLRRRVPNESVADDLLQDVWVKVARHLSQLPTLRKTDAWLYQIARNVLTDFYRRRKELTELPDDLATDLDDASIASLQQRLNEYVREVAAALPEPHREALRLTLYEGLSQVDLAKRLGLSISAAKSRVQRARAEVRRQMEKCCDWEFDAYGNALACEPRSKDSCDKC